MKSILFLLITSVLGLAQVPTPTGYFQPIDWVAVNPVGGYSSLLVDGTGNLYTVGAPGLGQTPTGYIQPMAPVAYDSQGKPHYLIVDSNGNLQISTTGVYVDARSYGVVCDGHTDSSTTLQAAMDAAITANVPLFIPSNANGDCFTSQTLHAYKYIPSLGYSLGGVIEGVGNLCNNYDGNPSTSTASCIEYTGSATAVAFSDGTHVTYTPGASNIGVKCNNIGGCTTGWDFSNVSEGYQIVNISTYPGLGYTPPYQPTYNFSTGIKLSGTYGLYIQAPLINNSTTGIDALNSGQFQVNNASMYEVLNPIALENVSAADFHRINVEMMDVGITLTGTIQAVSISGKFLIDPQFGFECGDCTLLETTGVATLQNVQLDNIYAAISLGVTQGTYLSGGTHTGTGQCLVSYTNGGGSGATGYLNVNAGSISDPTIHVIAIGVNYTSAPTTASLGACGGSCTAGSASCSGTASVITTLPGVIPNNWIENGGSSVGSSGRIDVVGFVGQDVANLCDEVNSITCNTLAPADGLSTHNPGYNQYSQIFFSTNNTGFGSASDAYVGMGIVSAGEVAVQQVMPNRGAIQKCYANCQGGIASGSWTFTARKNGADCGAPSSVSFVCDSGHLTPSDITNYCSYVEGDKIDFKAHPSSGSASVGVYPTIVCNK